MAQIGQIDKGIEQKMIAGWSIVGRNGKSWAIRDRSIRRIANVLRSSV